MSNNTRSFFLGGAAAGAMSALLASGLLVALPASAEVTGFDTGYSYHQGLAIGAGGALMAAQYGTDAGTVARGPVMNSNGTAIAPNPSAVVPSETVVPTTQVAPAPTAAVAPSTQSSMSFADIFTPGFVAGSLILLALVGIGVWAFSRRSREDEAYSPMFS